jgi:hypothetical protein
MSEPRTRGGVDSHRLAKFLAGDVDAAERARTLADLASLPCEQLDVFADAAAVLRDTERNQTQPPVRSPDP